MNLYYEYLDETLIINKAAASHDSQINNRSSCSQMFFKIGVHKNFGNFTGKHLCWSFFNKVVGLQAYNFIKERL